MQTTRTIVRVGQDAALLDRIERPDGSPYIVADIASIALTVLDLDTGLTTASTSPNVSTSVLSLARADGWTRDIKGRNVKINLLASHYPTEGRTYRATVAYSAVDGSPIDSTIVELQAVAAEAA